MGCLSVNTNLIQFALSVTALSPFATYEVECVTRGLDVACEVQSESLDIEVDAGGPIVCKVGVKDSQLLDGKISCSLICSIDRDQRYVIVNPDIIWLPQDWGIDSEFTVYSNVDWVIE
jgi:hypothetical protein